MGELCRKFICQCEGGAGSLIDLSETAKALGEEKKRLQHVISILSGFAAISRKSKGIYEWNGLDKMTKCISEMEVPTVNRALERKQ